MGAGSSESGAKYSANDKKVYDSTAPTAIRCLSRFMLGSNRSMEVGIRQDEVLMFDKLILIGDISEKERVNSCYKE